MDVSLYALTCGHLEDEFGRLMEAGQGAITLPIPVFLIEHPKGRALFDTGLHPDCQHDAVGRLGEAMTKFFKIRFRPGEEISARLKIKPANRADRHHHDEGCCKMTPRILRDPSLEVLV